MKSSNRALVAILSLVGAVGAACDAADDSADDNERPSLLEEPDDFDPDSIEVLTAEQAEALRADHVVASIDVDDLGTIEIVADDIDADRPELGYVVIGDSAALDLVRRFDEDGATPAEVFASITGESIPELLLRDHEARLAEQGLPAAAPRILPYTVPRALQVEANYCGNGVLFSHFKTKWKNDFYYSGYAACERAYERTKTSGNHAYFTPAHVELAALSACNKKVNGSPVLAQFHTYAGGGVWNPVWAGFINQAQAVHYYRTGADLRQTRLTTTNGTNPNTFVGWGYGFFPFGC